MAGRPKHRAMVAQLAGYAAEMDMEGATVLDFVVDWVASGRTVYDLARQVGADTKLDVTREMVSRYVNGLEEDASERIASARTRGATAMVEEAKAIVDEKRDTREELTRAKNQAEMRMWFAERLDRAAFGAPKQQPVQVTIQTLHLDALRSRTVVTARVVEAEPELAQLVAGE